MELAIGLQSFAIYTSPSLVARDRQYGGGGSGYPRLTLTYFKTLTSSSNVSESWKETTRKSKETTRKSKETALQAW